MQVLILTILLGLLLHDQFSVTPNPPPTALSSLLGWLGLPLLASGLYALACLYTLRGLTGPRAFRRLRELERVSWFLRALVLLAGLGWLSMGTLTWLRQSVVDTIALDELLFICPTLLFIVLSWSAWYPIDRRLRQAGLLARIDASQAVYPIWSLSQYLANQFRHQVALLGLPLLLFLIWQETVLRLGPQGPNNADRPIAWALLGLGGLALFFAAPWLIRHIWQTRRLPPGPLREQLEAMCRMYRVRVREILLWQTFGTVANAVVLGFVRPLRYILLSDALLEHLSPRHIEAVMAHELAHIRQRHIPWLMVWAAGLIQSLTGLLTLVEQYVSPPEQAGRFEHYVIAALPAGSELAEMLVLVAAAVCWFGLFGWIARRFERQADVLAVVHMAQTLNDQNSNSDSAPDGVAHPTAPRIDHRSILIVQQALQAIAQLNGIAPRRPSWRHGSIAWRQQYLSTLAGQPIDQMAIDRQVRRLQVAGLVLLALSLLSEALI